MTGGCATMDGATTATAQEETASDAGGARRQGSEGRRIGIADVVPHVRSILERHCGGDATAIAQMLAALDPEQRRGWRILPDPLPAVPALAAHAERILPVDADPEQVLSLAVCGAGSVRVLAAIAGCAPDRIPQSPLAGLVDVRGGRFRFVDAALRAHVLAAATPQERLRAHRRLVPLIAGAGAEAGDEGAVAWHRARGALAGDPALVEPLLGRACDALRSGDAERAWRGAAEAAEHARPGTPAHARALLCGGRAALAGGWVADAVERIEQALRIEGGHQGEATAALVLAHALRHGSVPAPDQLMPAAATGRGFRRAAALGASLSAERGDRERRAQWLAVGARLGRDPDDRATLLGWCDALAGDAPVGDAGTGSVGDAGPAHRVAHALCAGLDGDPDAGVRALTEPGATDVADPVLGLYEHSPLLRARRAVVEVMLHVWAGRIGAAYELLAASAAELPVALPFAGIAVALSRRLDLAVDGRIGTLSRELAAGVPWTQAPDGFVDRAIDAYLQGRSDEAAVHMALWADRGCPGELLGLPGLDEIGPLSTSAAPEPPDAADARALRERVRAARESSWRTDLDVVAEESRGIRSAFERARVEALLGSTCAARGDRGRGVRHLRAARSLFDESGARAWRGMVDRRLRMMAERRRRGAADDETRAAPPSLEVCRATWEPVLTVRELEVALLIAEGRTNREIADALHVSVRTVEVHGGRIFAKLDVRTRHELTVLAHRTDQHL
ncbi:MAG: helix-turn-helix transcriptional regulator [Actinobacteria bacterium]|nr:helix-turn-helix transcriptional regulator [Actinomycetota bacterium]